MLKCTNNKADTTTNEEMALLIQQGYSEYTPLLWERVYPLICYILQRQICNYPLPNYITIEDLKQQMYFAFLRAIKVYTEEKGYKFSTYLTLNILSEIERTIYCKETKKQEFSYNKALQENENELEYFLDDTNATKYVQELELRELYTTLHNAINALTPIEKSIITQYFYLNKSDNTIAMCSGMTTNEIFNIRRNAINKLRKNKVLCRFYKAYYAT